jgi:hypothetical protein
MQTQTKGSDTIDVNAVVFNIGDEPLIAFVARSAADEWDKIINYPSVYRPAE